MTIKFLHEAEVGIHNWGPQQTGTVCIMHQNESAIMTAQQQAKWLQLTTQTVSSLLFLTDWAYAMFSAYIANKSNTLLPDLLWSKAMYWYLGASHINSY